MAKLAPKVRQKVIDLLMEGKVTKREIQRLTKVSRPTIDKIEKQLLHPPEEKEAVIITLIRCKGCGGKIYSNAECLVCQITEQIEKAKKETGYTKREVESYDEFMESLIGPIPSSDKNLAKGS